MTIFRLTEFHSKLYFEFSLLFILIIKLLNQPTQLHTQSNFNVENVIFITR